MKTIDVKVWPAPFQAVVDGDKNWEFLLNDRNYEIGDELHGREWDPKTQSYAGRTFTRRITYVLREGFGLPDGYVILSLEVPGVASLRHRAFLQAAEMVAEILNKKAEEVLGVTP